MFEPVSPQAMRTADRALAALEPFEAGDPLAAAGCATICVLGALKRRFETTPTDHPAFDLLCGDVQTWLRREIEALRFTKAHWGNRKIALDRVCLLGVTYMARFGTVLRRFRVQRKMTQEELASKVKVTRFYISQLENGLRTNPSIPVLKRLAKALKVKVGELVE